MRSLGLFSMTISTSVLPPRVTCVFLTVAALRISWASVICYRIVLSKFLEVVSTSAEKPFKQSDSDFSSICPRSMWSSKKSLNVVHSIECLHVMKMMESHVCTNRLRIHL